MRAGSIVRVNWRDALAKSGEPNKMGRPGVVVSAPPTFGGELAYELVVPLTSDVEFALPGSSVLIDPTPENGATASSFALAWNVQAVPHERIRKTPAFVNDAQLREIREQIAACIGIVVKSAPE